MREQKDFVERHHSETTINMVIDEIVNMVILELMRLFLINIFIDHHTVKLHLLIHICNTDTIYELISGQKRLDIFTFTVLISYT